MSAETAAVLDEAANVIRRNGWHQGNMFAASTSKKAEDCPVCAWGAIAIAACGTPNLATNENLRKTRPAIKALTRFLGLDEAFSDWGIPTWNDGRDTTAEQVITALEAAARIEREAAA